LSRGDWHGAEWDRWGKDDPYFGVISLPEFHAGRMDAAGRRRFFESGTQEVIETLAAVRDIAGHTFTPTRVLDFGCGVGRLTIPLARIAQEVVGVDVSPAMLEEAGANCREAGITNATFRLSERGLPTVQGTFDFVHSYIVFQHIPPVHGYHLFEDLLDRVTDEGAGMVHFTVSRKGSLLRRLAHSARSSSRLVHRLLNVIQGRPFEAPLMAAFPYDLNRLLGLLHDRGFHRIGGRLTDHGGWQGVMLAFARQPNSAPPVG
jgi:SAM-dependent methyltransferase